MQAKQRLRQRAPVLFGDPAAQAEASKVRQQRAAEAAARSARILEQERAKDANWREAMLREVQQVGCQCCTHCTADCINTVSVRSGS